jgi:hypothetical protein
MLFVGSLAASRIFNPNSISNLESRRVISVREVILKVGGIKAPMIAALDNTHTSCDSPLGAAFAERSFS